eukprot:TRINITY_DN1228_c2_g2_i1.p2 TRINITY_DN1228_c2_g2~~TRINITY_DN1228_c2_g2_i1.p2  ORF type:complete len:134 (-),score=10.99 TRINITY_DN1228_c2_g2_i1:413-814(-)
MCSTLLHNAFGREGENAGRDHEQENQAQKKKNTATDKKKTNIENAKKKKKMAGAGRTCLSTPRCARSTSSLSLFFYYSLFLLFFLFCFALQHERVFSSFFLFFFFLHLPHCVWRRGGEEGWRGGACGADCFFF